MMSEETRENKSFIDRVLLNHKNTPMSITEIRSAISMEFGKDLTYYQVYHILHYDKYCTDYIKTTKGTIEKYQLEAALYLCIKSTLGPAV